MDKNALRSVIATTAEIIGNVGAFLSLALVLTQPQLALANPQGGQVVGGQATITQTSPTKLDVYQHTDRTAIDWQSFNIGAGEHTQFHQPSSSSIALNRVVGHNPSEILGRLSANGQIILINPDGIHFGKGSRVDVAGLIASTHDIRTDDFMAGRMDFSISGNPTASIVNEGDISVADQGLAAFVAPGVRNDGVIVARLGSVQLASATHFTLDLYGDGQLMFPANDQVLEKAIDKDGKPLNATVDNTGRISADGGYVLLRADAVRGLIDSVINTSGIVEARSVAEVDGKIVLSGGDAGIVSVTGALDASGTAMGETGGTVQVTGENIGLFNQARVDVSGDAGGGTVNVGGNYKGQGPLPNASGLYVGNDATINANALTNGNGGRIINWSNDATRTYGTLTARGGTQGGNGGFIETSSAGFLDVRGAPDASAPNGKSGTWLLDPANLTIQDAATANAVTGSCNAGPTQCSLGGSYDAFTDTALHQLSLAHDYFGSDEANSVVNTVDIETALNAGTNVEVTTDNYKGSVVEGSLMADDTGQAGTLTVANQIDKTGGGDATLALSARSDLTINAPITSTSNKLNLALYSKNGKITSAQTITTNGGSITLDAPGNIEFNNSAATRAGDLTVYAYGGSGSANVNVRWDSDRVQFTHNGSRANIPTNGIALSAANVTTTTNFSSLEGVYNNNAVTLSGAGTRNYAFDFNNGLFGANQATDGTAEFVGFSSFSVNPESATSIPSGITPTFEVDLNGTVTQFTTINVTSSTTTDQEQKADSHDQRVAQQQDAPDTQAERKEDASQEQVAKLVEQTPVIQLDLEPVRYETAEELANNITKFGDNGLDLNEDPAWNAYPMEMRQQAYAIATADRGARQQIAGLPAAPVQEEDPNRQPNPTQSDESSAETRNVSREPSRQQTALNLDPASELFILTSGFPSDIKQYLLKNFDDWQQSGAQNQAFTDFAPWVEAYGQDAIVEYIFHFKTEIEGKSRPRALAEISLRRDTWRIVGEEFVGSGPAAFGRGMTFGLSDGQFLQDISNQYNTSVENNLSLLVPQFEKYKNGEISLEQLSFHAIAFAGKSLLGASDAAYSSIFSASDVFSGGLTGQATDDFKALSSMAAEVAITKISATEIGRESIQALNNGLESFRAWTEENPEQALVLMDALAIAEAIPAVRGISKSSISSSDLSAFRISTRSKLNRALGNDTGPQTASRGGAVDNTRNAPETSSAASKSTNEQTGTPSQATSAIPPPSFRSNLLTHLSTPQINEKGTFVSGGHNKDNFLELVEKKLVKMPKDPDTIEFKNGIADYPYIVVGGDGEIHTKTVYDPKIWSDERIMSMGESAVDSKWNEAVQSWINHNRDPKYSTPTAEFEGITFRFHIYVDGNKNPYVGALYPYIPR